MQCIWVGCPSEAVIGNFCSCCNERLNDARKRVSQPGHTIKGHMSVFNHNYQNPIHSNYDLIHDMNSIGPGHKLKQWDVKD